MATSLTNVALAGRGRRVYLTDPTDRIKQFSMLPSFETTFRTTHHPSNIARQVLERNECCKGDLVRVGQ